MAECQLPKLDVAGSNPVGRSTLQGLRSARSAGPFVLPYGQVVPVGDAATVPSPLAQTKNMPVVLLEYL